LVDSRYYPRSEGVSAVLLFCTVPTKAAQLCNVTAKDPPRAAEEQLPR